LGEECLAYAKHTQACKQRSEEAYEKLTDAMADEPRWGLKYVTSGPKGTWRALGVGIAITPYGKSRQCEERWFPLKAKTENQAKREMAALDRKPLLNTTINGRLLASP
jgi:hypothetical protein